MISKGLPSALRSTLKSSIDSGEWTKSQHYMASRVRAADAGKAGNVEGGQVLRKESKAALEARMPKRPTPDTNQLIRRNRLRLHREGKDVRPKGLGKIPKQAFTQGKGKVRVTGYEGDGRFTAVTNRDEKIVRSRDAYKFQKGLPSALKPHVWSEDARALHSAFPSTTKAARVARGAIKSGADDPKALKAASKAEPKGAYILSRLESKRLGDIAGMRGNINRKSDIQAGRAVRRSVQKNAFGVTDARSK